MDFRKIKQTGNGDLEIIEELKKSNRKIYVYGCGTQAEMLCRYLTRNGLVVEGYFVDQCYYRENFYISGLKVNNIKDFAECLDDFNIVIGFCEINKSKFLLENKEILKGNYFLIWENETGYIWDEEYFTKHDEELSRIYNELADRKSKDVFRELAHSKVNYRIGNLLLLADNNQYFNELTFERDSSDEIYVDCGAFNGDTVLKYSLFTDGKYKKIYAFEPEENNLEQLKKNTEKLHDIEIVPKGVWNKEGLLGFNTNGSASCIVGGGKYEYTVNVTSIDHIVGNDKITFIKMDVEGSELEALKGARRTIKRNMPKLAICCYHKADDLINLYAYIHSFDKEDMVYRFYLRHHSNSAYETVLYAIPVKK